MVYHMFLTGIRIPTRHIKPTCSYPARRCTYQHLSYQTNGMPTIFTHYRHPKFRYSPLISGEKASFQGRQRTGLAIARQLCIIYYGWLLNFYEQFSEKGNMGKRLAAVPICRGIFFKWSLYVTSTLYAVILLTPFLWLHVAVARVTIRAGSKILWAQTIISLELCPMRLIDGLINSLSTRDWYLANGNKTLHASVLRATW